MILNEKKTGKKVTYEDNGMLFTEIDGQVVGKPVKLPPKNASTALSQNLKPVTGNASAIPEFVQKQQRINASGVKRKPRIEKYVDNDMQFAEVDGQVKYIRQLKRKKKK
jgi:hypothetical protein